RVGFPVGPEPAHVVPIVPAAVIYDLGRGGDFRAAPDAAMGADAYDAAMGGTGPLLQGSVGAGTAAVAGGLAGGVGTASAVLDADVTVAALVVVNAMGSTVDASTGELSGTRVALPGEFPVKAPSAGDLAGWRVTPASPGGFHTTLAVVATDAALAKVRCAKLAGIGHDGMARAIRPVHTMLDGDTVFALATGAGAEAGAAVFHQVLSAAADCVSRAVAHAMLHAAGRPGAPSYLDAFPSARH
ncbi:MAG TPA: P1 family peptidase, partial [Cryptosporangiaceae bacterium]|nr:P1 family peptidase [Cryptosporangiaceae bacterium]